ncbi:hypothetical protein [Facklamia sp. P12955]|uniref:hypothetical protein n=1 Tax=Facklamia sp. P12955 TaxID=3421946 RepID=UPI003D184826
MDDKNIFKEIASLKRGINDLYSEIESLEFKLTQKITEEKTDLEFQISRVEDMVTETFE